MMIEIAPSNSFRLFYTAMDWLNRCFACGIGISLCGMGISVLLIPGFEAEAMTVIKSLIGVLLLMCGVTMMRVGTVRDPLNLAFDRTTEEWKVYSRKGKSAQFEPAAPRGSVLTLKSNGAALKDDRANPLFDLHLNKPAHQTLMSEYQRLQAAV